MLNYSITLLLVFATTGIPFYFQYWAQSAPKKTLEEINAKSAKLMLVCLLNLFMSSFLGVATGSKNLGGVSFGAAFLSLMLLFSFRTKIIHSIRGVRVKPKDQLEQSVRGILALSFLYGTYYLIVHGLARWITTLPALAIGITFVIFLAPIMIRIMFPTTRMFDSKLKGEIKDLFKSTGVEIGEIYILNTDRFKISNALVCGSKYGFGPFRRSLFLTENLFSVLEEDELKSVLLHEASHFQLHHLAKRGFASFCAVVAAMVVTGIPAGMLTMILPHQGYYSSLIMGSMIAVNFWFQFNFIFKVIRKQEFEADLNSVKLGGSPEALVSALQKIIRFNGGSEKKESTLARWMFGSGHPSFEERKNAILSASMPKERLLPEMKWVYGYSTACCLLLIGLWVRPVSHPERVNREVASQKSTSALSTSDSAE